MNVRSILNNGQVAWQWLNDALVAVRYFLSGVPLAELVFLLQAVLMAVSLLVHLIYPVLVFRDRKTFNAMHRRRLVSIFRTGFWFGLLFQVPIWLTGSEALRFMMVWQNPTYAVGLVVAGLISLLLSLIALFQKRRLQRSIIASNLVRYGSVSLGAALLLYLLSWLVG